MAGMKVEGQMLNRLAPALLGAAQLSITVYGTSYRANAFAMQPTLTDGNLRSKKADRPCVVLRGDPWQP